MIREVDTVGSVIADQAIGVLRKLDGLGDVLREGCTDKTRDDQQRREKILFHCDCSVQMKEMARRPEDTETALRFTQIC